MTSRVGRTRSEKMRALRVVSFELRQMAHATRLQRENEGAGGDPMAGNAFVDSAAVHARALIDFFIGIKGFKSDIRRLEFAPEWMAAPKRAVDRIESDGWMLNKYLAHLTWERVIPSGQTWDYPDLAEDVLDIADAWCAHLAATDADLADYFAGQIRPARAALAA